MEAFLWRVVYAVVGVLIFWLVVPLFLQVIGLPVPANVWQLLRVVVACIALCYVLFLRHQPPKPW